MKTGTVLISLLGFTLGGAAAWHIQLFPALTPASAEWEKSHRPALGKLGGKSEIASAWQALLAGGGQGISDRLLQADLVSRATSREMPRLLELAGKDLFAREMLLRRWAGLNPAGAAAWLEPLMKKGVWPGPEDQEKDVEIVFSAWAKNDPVAALARLRSNSAVGVGILWTGNVMTRLLNEDMAAGIRLGALTGSFMSLSKVFYRSSDSDWIKKDPAQAAALLSALPPGIFRDDHLAVTINELAKTDLSAAIALQQKYPRLAGGWESGSERPDLFAAWARKDPAGLEEYLNGTADAGDRPDIKSAIAGAMAEKDPRGALEWASTNLSGMIRDSTGRDILSKLTRENPEEALTYLDSLSEGTALNGAVETFTKALPSDNPEALLTRAEALPDGAARKVLTGKAYEKMYAQDPEGMLQNLASQPPASLPEGIWRQLGQTTGNMEDGINRLAALPPEAAAEFIGGVFQRNIQWYDMPKFSRTMDSLTDPGERAAAMDAVMQKLLWINPSQVTEWAKSLPPAERNQVADQMEKNIYHLTDNQRQEFITPLR